MKKTGLPKLDNFERWFMLQKASSPASIRAYKTDILQFYEYLANEHGEIESLEKLGRREMESFIAWLYLQGMSKSSMARKLAALRTFFKFLNASGFMNHNPLAGVRNPRQTMVQPENLNVDEVFSMLDQQIGGNALQKRDLALAELLYGSGLRVSEALNLDIDDLDGKNNYVKVMGKGSRERFAPLSDTALEALSQWLKIRGKLANINEKALFVGCRGNRLNRREAYRIIDNLCRQAGLRKQVSPHALRHSFASHMLSSGADMRAVQELLGHKRLSTTQRYTHLAMEELLKIYDSAHPRS